MVFWGEVLIRLSCGDGGGVHIFSVFDLLLFGYANNAQAESLLNIPKAGGTSFLK